MKAEQRALLTEPLGSLGNARELLESQKAEIARVARKSVPAELFTRVVLNSLGQDRELLRCTGASLMRVLCTCAELGIIPDTELQHAHLIPYGRECKLILGYRGLIELAVRGGVIKTPPYTGVVRHGDLFRVLEGTDRQIHHEPRFNTDPADSENPDWSSRPLLHVYAVVRYPGGEKDFEVMDRTDIDRIRGNKGGPWRDHYSEMARKTVLRRILKRVPMSEEFRRAEALDDEGLAVLDVTAREPRRMASAETLAENLRIQAEMQANGATERTPERPPSGPPEVDTGRVDLEAALRAAVWKLEKLGGRWESEAEIEDLSDAELRKQIALVEAQSYRRGRGTKKRGGP